MKRILLSALAAGVALPLFGNPLFTETPPDGLLAPRAASDVTPVAPTMQWEAPPVAAIPAAPAADAVRNIIYIIGDGMGSGAHALASLRAHGEQGRLVMDRLPHQGLALTHSKNSRVTDSAASGTALAAGFKTNNSSVGVLPDGSPCTSIAALAKARGMSVGILTDDYLAGATPAAFYAHQPNRAMTDEIMAELVHSGYEIFFANDTGSDSLRDNQTTGTNLVEVMTGLGYAFSYTVNDFKTSLTQSEKSVGLMPSGEISFQKGDVRVLGDVMQASLERLNRNPNGFFMLFECSLPDKGGHSSDMNQSVFGTLRTDWLVKTAVDFALTHPGTLVVVTADHETGGISAVRGTADADPVAYTREPNHTSAPVPVGAFGPGAQLFARVLDNTDIPRIMAYLLKLEMTPRS